MLLRAPVWLFLGGMLLTGFGAGVSATEPASAAERGYRHLVESRYLPPDFDQSTLDQVWRQWPQPLRDQAERASPQERRRLTYQRYGLTPRPDDPSRPLQYVVDREGNWSMNCFACHSGEVVGQVVPGLPNANFALELLTAEIRATKLALQRPLARMDVGSLIMPLGTTRGTTNAVMFGVALMATRDAELNVLPRIAPPPMVHHDMDAPPWWHFRTRPYLYIDGFAPKHPRALMQFMLVRENGPEKFREWESDFGDIYAYLESLTPPQFPFPRDAELAARGEVVFAAHCAGCHGTYGPAPTYPNRRIPLEEIGTDPVRLTALTSAHRESYAESWFHREDADPVITAPEGYVAPPLTGVWATAPYFHNGSVPTLWHVLHPAERPTVWQRDGTFQTERVGLGWSPPASPPAPNADPALRGMVFDTGVRGKSAAGHRYPEQLTEAEKLAVLEYLKGI